MPSSATVNDTDAGSKSAPTGTLLFILDPISRVPATSTLFPYTTLFRSNPTATSASCSLTYTPSATTGSHVVKGSYGADTLHAASSGTATVSVTKRATIGSAHV